MKDVYENVQFEVIYLLGNDIITESVGSGEGSGNDNGNCIVDD